MTDFKAVFANMLNEMRLGKITNETVSAFRKLSRRIDYEDEICATELYEKAGYSPLQRLTI
jgi:hypothetical protein